MNRNQIAFALLALLTGAVTLLGLGSSELTNNLSNGHHPEAVPYLDPIRFSGAWWEQAHTPMIYERGCTKTRSIYDLDAKGKGTVDYKCIKDGRDITAEMVVVPEDDTHAKMKVKPAGGWDLFAGSSWVVMLDENYEYYVTSSPDYRFMNIFAKQQKMDERVYNQIVEELRRRGGFRVDKLERT